MDQCIFCKIINNEIPSYKIYEDENVLVFLDISQVTKGHTLVIPKKHAVNIFDVDAVSMNNVYQIVQKLAKEIVEKLGAKGVNIINNNENSTILICSHGGTIRNIISYLLSGDYKYHWNFKIDNGSITEIEINNNFAVINKLNYTKY